MCLEYLHLCDLSAFVVATEDRDSVLEAHLQCHEQRDRFHAIVASVDVITHEEIVGVGWLASDFEELAQIMELTMDVTADSHWCFDLLHI